MPTLAVIPARYASSRLPGKPIREEAKRVTGKYLIQHVYEQVAQADVDQVIVATDDPRIYDAVKAFGGEAAMTSPEHRCGTERVAEVAAAHDADIVVNVQGDEPDLPPDTVTQVVRMLQDDPDAAMSTVAYEIDDPQELADSSAVKVVLDNRGYALYFSRHPIPFVRDASDPFREAPLKFLKHMGIYGYRRGLLLQYASLPATALEQSEKLEQLRALANGYRIRVGITTHRCMGIDTPEDMEAFLDRFRRP